MGAFYWSSLGDCTSGLVAGLVNNGMGAFYWSSLGDCTSGLVAGLVNTGMGASYWSSSLRLYKWSGSWS